MISRLRRMFGRSQPSQSTALRFDRPLVLFQSDDWSRVGVCDRDGWDKLRAKGLNLGENPYDSYSLETADDMQALSGVLKAHRDSTGRHPCLGMNFVMANVDFPRARDKSPQENSLLPVPLLPLTDGFPAPWERPGLVDAYHQGIRERVFYPALHGLTHFCPAAVERALDSNAECRQLLSTLWQAGTPYIHWRMPWVGYEYWDPAPPPDRRFLPLGDQLKAIRRAGEIYRALFASIPLSACAPGYRADQATRTAWYEAGVRVVQNGPAQGAAPQLDAKGMLQTFRTVQIEPATETCDLEKIVRQANDALTGGVPAVVSIHSINFHSTISNFRTPALAMLDRFLSALENRWPDLLYIHDEDLWKIATEGLFSGDSEMIRIGVTTAQS